MVRELEYSLNQELDFLQEAENTRLIGELLADFPHLTAPTVYSEYTSSRVLTMSFVHGRHLSEFSKSDLQAAGAQAIAEDLLSAYLKQVAIDGIFHCDPHPGNILLADDGRLALMDFGMVGRFDAGQKDHVILLLLAFSERLVNASPTRIWISWSYRRALTVEPSHRMSVPSSAITTMLVAAECRSVPHCLTSPAWHSAIARPSQRR
jgi:predicted unusual protein kinase regulating ubiquinone biosynthesis (AarF/ABC1/UbiB family)